MSINPLNDISRVYLEQVATSQADIEEGMTLGDYKKKRSALKQKEKRELAKTSPTRRAGIHNPEKKPERDARRDAAMGETGHGGPLRAKKVRKAKALGELGESAVPGKPAEKLGAVTAIPKSEQEAARERVLAKAAAMRAKKGIKKEALDPVGSEDRDVDNDGDHDKSDKYLLNRRKVRSAAISKKKSVKEGYSNWREDLSEIAEFISKDRNDQKITEKKVSNKIKINPTIGEAVENLGGTLIEMVEVDELDYILESAYDELLEEGYEEDDIEEALEFALTEAKVTYGHDTAPKATEKKKEGLLSAARKRLSGAKKAAKQAVATGARKVAKGALGVARRMEKGDGKPSETHTKTRTASTYRGAGAGQKEKVSSGSYSGPAKKKAEPVKDPWEGSATTPPKPKAKKVAAKPKATAKTTKAPAKKKKSSNLDNLIASIRSEEVQLDEKSLSISQQQAAGAALAAKRGDIEPMKLKGASIEMYKSMTEKQLRDFAKTKHEGLPKKKTKEEEMKEALIAKMMEKIVEQTPEIDKKTKQKPEQNASAINQVLQAKQKADTAQRELAMKQRMAAQKGVNLTSVSS